MAGARCGANAPCPLPRFSICTGGLLTVNELSYQFYPPLVVRRTSSGDSWILAEMLWLSERRAARYFRDYRPGTWKVVEVPLVRLSAAKHLLYLAGKE